MIPCEKENLNVILNSYEEIIGKHFNTDSGQSNPNAGGAEDGDSSNLDSPLLLKKEEEEDASDNEDGDETTLYKIEYYVVNMKRTLASKDLTEAIAKISDQDIGLLEIPCLQAIIKFKWKAYTRRFFVRQFYFMAAFLIFFFMDLGGLIDFDVAALDFITKLCLRIGCGICIFKLFLHELKQIRKSIKQYFSEFWNICDICFTLGYGIYVGLIYILDPVSDRAIIATLQCIIILLSFIKLNFFLRIFDSFSFLIQMLASVFLGLKNFLIFFAIFIFTFSAFLGVVMQPLDEFKNIEQVGFLIVAFRTSVGDFAFDNFLKEDN
jgi:hypothetical protein